MSADNSTPLEAQAAAKRPQRHLKELIELGIALSAENNLENLLERILLEAKNVAAADGGTLYLAGNKNDLEFAFVHNDSLELSMGGTTGKDIPFPNLQLIDAKTGKLNHKNVATHVANTKQTINIADVYDVTDFDFSGTRAFDEKTGYRSQSFLTVPLINNQQEVIAVLQLINASNSAGQIVAFSQSVARVVEALAAQAAVALDNQRMIRDQRRMLESFIKLIAHAIDAKSAFTGAHCQRVPDIAKMLAEEAQKSDLPGFSGFKLDDNEWYGFYLASWLHDCGKVTTPEYVVDKATKLETVHNRIHEVRTRFEILLRDAKILYLKKKLNKMGTDAQLKAQYDARVAELTEQFEFIAKCNVGNEFMPEEDIARLYEISKQTVNRYYDRTLGLSAAEKRRTQPNSTDKMPVCEPLLEDREDHIYDNYNRGELYNLQIARGTLTEEERIKINEHIDVTIDMLNALPFPNKFNNVPEFAGAHHERMDGKGYPAGLTKEQMSIPARIMAIADIFEALTASDRPYKRPKTLTQVLKIMSFMKKEGHIDPDLFDLFLNENVWHDYAEQYLDDSQIDDVDISDYR